MMALKAFIKPFEAPQRSVKINIKDPRMATVGVILGANLLPTFLIFISWVDYLPVDCNNGIFPSIACCTSGKTLLFFASSDGLISIIFSLHFVFFFSLFLPLIKNPFLNPQ